MPETFKGERPAGTIASWHGSAFDSRDRDLHSQISVCGELSQIQRRQRKSASWISDDATMSPTEAPNVQNSRSKTPAKF